MFFFLIGLKTQLIHGGGPQGPKCWTSIWVQIGLAFPELNVSLCIGPTSDENKSLCVYVYVNIPKTTRSFVLLLQNYSKTAMLNIQYLFANLLT